MSSSNVTQINEILKNRGIDTAALDNDDYVIPEPHESFKRLLDLYYVAKVSADVENPYWYNRVWWENDGEIIEIRRAKALRAAMEHATPNIIPGEKLVMAKTYTMRGAFPFPWVMSSFFNGNAEQLMSSAIDSGNEEDRVSQAAAGGGNVTESYGEIISLGSKFGIRKEDIPALVTIAETWKETSLEVLSDKYGKELPSYDQYQRLCESVVTMAKSFGNIQGREVMNYYLPLQYGFDRLLEMCDEKLAEVGGESGGDGILGMSRTYYYIAMKEIIQGLSKWCENYARKATDMASVETDPAYKKNYEDIATVMTNIAHKAPATFREALQMTLCLHYAVINEDPHSGQAPGRIGQILDPFYEKDLEDGTITEEDAIELLELYRIKLTCIECLSSPAISNGINAGYTFNNVSIGGVKANGKSAVTPVDYLLVEAGMRGKTTQPTLSLLYDDRLPDDFLLKCMRCIKTGCGYPAIMNSPIAIEFLIRQYGEEGMTIEDARAWAIGGCLEVNACCWNPLEYNGKVTMIPGGASPTPSNGIHFISLPKVLELVLHNGKDPRTGKQTFPAHDQKIESFDQMMDLWKQYMDIACRVVNNQNNIHMDLVYKTLPPMTNSLLKADCFKNGHHKAHMGCRYNAVVNYESCGTITFINSLASLKKNVFDDKKYTLDEMSDALENNFGYKTAFETQVYSPDYRIATDEVKKYEQIYMDCLNAPKYGNGIDYVDSLLEEYINYMTEYLRGITSYFGNKLYMCQISVSTHAPQGFVTLATADGRLTGTTFVDGSVSASPSTDKNGIFALFKSASVYDHSRVQNSQMNLKLHPTAVRGLNGSKKLLDAVQTYMHMGGFHVQFNVVDSHTLTDAQKKPDNYRDLIVRVAGYTQYWCEVPKPIQDEVIFRTEHEAV